LGASASVVLVKPGTVAEAISASAGMSSGFKASVGGGGAGATRSIELG